MQDTFYFKTLRLWIQGILLFCLRWAQLKNGFDPVTGLARSSLPGTILVAAIVFLAAVEIVLAFKSPKGKYIYENSFASLGQKHLPFIAAGSLLLCAGGVLLPGWNLLECLTAAAGAAAAVGVIVFVRQVRGGGTPRSYPLLPAMAFSVLFVLEVYLPHDSSPVLESYYLQVLTAAMIACAFYQLAGFPCGQASMRWFRIFGNLAVPLSIACLAGSIGTWGEFLIYLGCALMITVFLSLRLADASPEAEDTEESAEGTE